MKQIRSYYNYLGSLMVLKTSILAEEMKTCCSQNRREKVYRLLAAYWKGDEKVVQEREDV